MNSMLLNLIIVHIMLTVFCIISIKCAQIKITKMTTDIRFAKIISQLTQSAMKNYNPYILLWIMVPVVNILFLIIYSVFSFASDESIINFFTYYMETCEKKESSEKNNKDKDDNNDKDF